MITIGEIAELAGVSTATVSRVINSSGYVKEDTKRKIEAIIKEYHYIPSAAAQNLSRKETNTIGIIVPELNNIFFGEVLAGAAEVIDRNNLTMMVCDTNNNAEKEAKALALVRQQRVKGLIFTPAVGYNDEKMSRNMRKQLKDLKVPVVIVDREIENSQWDSILYENFQSGYLATERLIKLGKKKIGMILGNLELKHGRERYEGYLQAMEDYNLAVDEKYLYEGDFSTEKAYKITKEILQSGDYPEALVLSNNLTTIGYIKAMAEEGYELNSVIQTVSIDNISLLDIMGYHYECVTRDTRMMGVKAVELLLKRFENPTRNREIRVMPCITQFKEKW